MGNYALDCDEQYYAYANSADVHDITTENISCSAQVAVPEDHNSHGMIVYKQHLTLAYAAYGWYLMIRDNGKICAVGICDEFFGGWAITLTGSTDIRDGLGHHIAFFLDRGDIANCKVLLDGVDDTDTRSGSIDTTSISSTGALCFGCLRYPDNGAWVLANYFDGHIYDVKLYISSDDVWSEGEIAYQSRHPKSKSYNIGAITERWLCDEGSGLILAGSEGNNMTLTHEEVWLDMPFEWSTEEKIQTYLDAESTISVGDGASDNYALADAERVEYDVVAEVKQYLAIPFSALPATPPDVLIAAVSKLSASGIAKARMGSSMGNEIAEWTSRLSNEAWSSLQRIALSQILDGATKRSMSMSDRLILTKTRERGFMPNV